MRWNVIGIDHRLHPRHPLLVVLAIVCIVRVLRSQPIYLVLSFAASMPCICTLCPRTTWTVGYDISLVIYGQRARVVFLM